MKVLISSSCMSPLFINKGGAVGTLIESIINQNEKNKKFDLTLVLRYNKNTDKIVKKYKNTKFIFIKEPKILEKLYNIIDLIYIKIQHKPYKVPKKYLWKIYVLIKLKKILLKENYNRIIFENNGYLLKTLENEKISEKYKENVYFHVHNDIPNNISKICLKKCKILLISEYLKKKIINKCGESIEKQIFILKNGLDISSFTNELKKAEENDLKKELNIDLNKKIVLFTGRCIKEKGIEELIKAFKILNNRQDYILLIVGPYNFGEKQKYKVDIKLDENLNEIKSSIRFTGFVNHEDIWKYYKIANVAVLPSMWEEPAGLTMIESILSGTPLITTNSGGIPEYVGTNDAVILDRDEKLSDKIAKYIDIISNDNSKWKEKTNNSLKKFKKIYNEEQYFNNFVNILQRNCYKGDADEKSNNR